MPKTQSQTGARWSKLSCCFILLLFQQTAVAESSWIISDQFYHQPTHISLSSKGLRINHRFVADDPNSFLRQFIPFSVLISEQSLMRSVASPGSFWQLWKRPGQIMFNQFHHKKYISNNQQRPGINHRPVADCLNWIPLLLIPYPQSQSVCYPS